MIIENNFDYGSVPRYFMHCLHNECSKTNSCLRHVAWANRSGEELAIKILNPSCIPADTTNCPHFKMGRKIRLAWGVKRLFDHLPYKIAKATRQQIVNHYGKTLYYRFYREERPLMPKDQEFIRKVFTKNGISEEPNFERYTEQYIF